MTTRLEAPAPSNKRGPVAYLAAGGALLLLCLLCTVVIAGAYYFHERGTTAAQPAVEYVLDASPRMAQTADTGSGTRLAVAQSVLDEIVRPSEPTLTAGFRVFGTGKLADACTDTDLLVPLARASQGKISSSLLAVNTGSKPDAAMAAAIVGALRDLSSTKGPHTLVVVTGGSDSCSAQAGQLIAAEAKRDGIDYQLFVVGYLLPKDQGVAVSGLVNGLGSGHYLEASTRDQLKAVLTLIQGYVSNPKKITVASVLATAAALPTATQPVATIIPATATPPAPAAKQFGLTACDNPFFPMRPGSTWQYKNDNGVTESWTVTGVTGDTAAAKASLSFEAGGQTATGDWQCSNWGIAANFIPEWETISGVYNFKVVSSTGVWLPPADQLIAGASWVASYAAIYNDPNFGTTLNTTETIVDHSTCAGAEQVTVGGKIYDAVRVDVTRTDDTKSTPDIAGRPPDHFVFAMKMWYARGVGRVLLTYTEQSGPVNAGQSYRSELGSYTIP